MRNDLFTIEALDRNGSLISEPERWVFPCQDDGTDARSVLRRYNDDSPVDQVIVKMNGHEIDTAVLS